MGRNRRAKSLGQHLGKIGLQRTVEEWIIGQVAGHQFVKHGHLGVGQHHGVFGGGQAQLAGAALGDLVVVWQELDGTVQAVAAFQPLHQALLAIQHIQRPVGGNVQRLGLVVVVLQHQVADLVGHGGQQVVALLQGQVTGFHHAAQQDLDVDFVVGAVHAGRVVDGIRIDQTTLLRVFDAAVLRATQVAAFGYHLAAQLRAVDPEGVAGLVADLGMGLEAGLDIGADAAVVQQVYRCLQDGLEQLDRCQLFGGYANDGACLGAQRDGLGAARIDAAALRDQALVVVIPAGAGQVEEALALGKRAGHIRRGVDEDVAVVKGQHQLDLFGQQHAVAKHVARHVTDAGHGEGCCLGVVAQRAEVAFDCLPGAACGDAHLLVVVANRAARGKCITQPEAVVGGHAVGNVGEGGRALVGRHHQVGVVHVVAHHAAGGHNGALDDVVGDVQQAAEEQFVAGNALGHEGLAVTGRRCILQHEAALGSNRHDDRVLDLLGLDQTEDFGAEVFATIRPAQAAARHLATTQVHAFDPGRIHPDFKQRLGLGHARHFTRVELEAHIGLGSTVGGGLPQVGAQCGQHGGDKLAQDAVLVQTGHLSQGRVNVLLDLVLYCGTVAAVRGVETGHEQFDDGLRNAGILVQCCLDVALAEGKAQLFEVAGVGAKYGDGAGIQAGDQHQLVQVVALDLTAPGGCKQGLKAVLDRGQVGVHWQLQTQVVDPPGFAIAANAVGVFVQHARAHALQHRQGI